MNKTTFIAKSLQGCLKRRYYNSLFKKTYNSYIVGANNTKVNTLKDTISQAKEAEEVDNRIKILTLQSPQWTEVDINNTSFLVKNLQESVNSNKTELINLLLTIKDFISGALVCQLTTLTFTGLSWSLIISLLNSNLDNSFDLNSRFRHKEGLIVGLFIKRDRFTSSFKSRRFSGT